MMKKNIFVLRGQHYLTFFNDVNSMNDATIAVPTEFDRYITKLCSWLKQHLKKSSGIRQCLWKGYSLNRMLDKSEEQIIFFTDYSFKGRYDADYINYIRRRQKCKTVMLLYNKIGLLYGKNGNEVLDNLYDKELYLPFDKIYTYDLDESEKFNIEYFEAYSKIPDIQKDSEKESDCFYFGAVTRAWKGTRIEIIEDLYTTLTQKGVKCDFHVVNKVKDLKVMSEIQADGEKSYLEILRMNMETNCIVDIVSDGKYGMTLRVLEAIVYNKKLLTNNPNVKRHPFYNAKYMQVFSNVQDIDISFLMRREKVDYGYKNEFSPITLAQKLNSDFFGNKI